MKNIYFNKSEIFVKCAFSLLCVVVFLIVFFEGNGMLYFYKTAYAGEFSSESFSVHTINVGQGDSFLIELSDGKTMLIDAGAEDESDVLVSYIKQFMKKENRSQIDYFVLTHEDSDHTGGAKKILQNFAVKNLFRPKIYSKLESENEENNLGYDVSDESTYNSVIDYANSKNITTIFSEKGIKIENDFYTIEFLSPEEDSYSNSNNFSAVIKLTTQNKSFLFMGDATNAIEKTLIEEYGEQLKADVLKVGHHGSNSSTSQDFLDVVEPEYAILSYGENSYNLPNYFVTQRLQESGVKMISTFESGNFVMAIKNDKIVVGYQDSPIADMPLVFSIFLLINFMFWRISFFRVKNRKFFGKNAKNFSYNQINMSK